MVTNSFDKKLLAAVFLFLISGCASVTREEIEQAQQTIFFEAIKPGEIRLHLISPGGYYLPWAKYEIKIDQSIFQLPIKSYQAITLNRRKRIRLTYRYNEGFERSLTEWKTVEFEVAEKDVFLLFQDLRVTALSTDEVIEEVILISRKDS